MNYRSNSQILHDKLAGIIANTGPGEKLLSEPKLSSQLGVSRATLREAMRTFETQGYIRRRQGVGTFVIHPSHVIESGLEVLESIESLAERIGQPVFMGTLIARRIDATEEQRKELGLETGKKVLSVSRVINADNRPVAYLVDTLPLHVLDLGDIPPEFSGSVLDLLMEKDELMLTTSRCEISAIGVESEIAKMLNIQRDDAVLEFKSLLFSADGTPVDFSYSYFLPGYFRFRVIRRVGSKKLINE